MKPDTPSRCSVASSCLTNPAVNAMKRFVVSLSLAFGLGICSPTHAQAPPLPLQADSSWTYTAKVDWTEENSNKVRSDTVEWKEEVVSSITDASRTIAIVRGFPFELAMYEPSRAPALYVLLQTQQGLWLSRADSETQARQIAHQAERGEPIGSQLIEYPIRKGNCADRIPDRGDDDMYCWLVEDEIRHKGKQGWRIVYRCLSSHEIIEFVPELGITAYTYGHHGTVANASARLKRYSSASAQRPAEHE